MDVQKFIFLPGLEIYRLDDEHADDDADEFHCVDGDGKDGYLVAS